MNSAADLGGIFIVQDVTVRTSVQIEYGRYRTSGKRLDIITSVKV